MAIQAALFDCDGTILDSMPMWVNVLLELLESYDVENKRELADSVEHLNVRESLEVFAEMPEINDDVDSMYERLTTLVRNGYKKRVKPMPGIDGLLNQLKDAGIPMGVVSSTPAQLVEEALIHHNYRDYFAFVLSTEDIGKDKTHPDIYEKGLELLGVSKRTCWVFEDAPFAAKTATEAGFPVISLLNDHDGRDPELMKEYSDILVRDSYEAINLSIIEDYKLPKV